MTGCKQIDDYIRIVRSGEYEVCKDQLKLCDFVERIFAEETLTINTDQLAEYLSYEKYFPFGLGSPFGFIAWFSQTPDLLLTGFLLLQALRSLLFLLVSFLFFSSFCVLLLYLLCT